VLRRSIEAKQRADEVGAALMLKQRLPARPHAASRR
jgi:hypothetical protein